MIVSFICDICKSFHNAVIWDRCFHHCFFTLGLVFVSLDNSPRIPIMVLTTNRLLLFSCNVKWMVVTPFIKCDKKIKELSSRSIKRQEALLSYHLNNAWQIRPLYPQDSSLSNQYCHNVNQYMRIVDLIHGCDF